MTVLTLPSTRQEAWRWADIDGIAAAASLPRAEARFADDLWLDLPGDRLLFVDGVLHDSSRLGRAEVAEVTGSDHPLAERTSGRGWALRLDKDAVADPVQVVHLSTGGDNHLACEILLADDAVGTVVETYAGRGWANRFARIGLGRAARLQRAVRLLQDEGFASVRDEAELGAGASFVQIALGVGNAGSRIDAHVAITGDAGFAEYGGALLARGTQRQECAVTVRHAAVAGQSRQYWRAVAADQSAVSLAARVDVARHAQKTDGEQSLRGLLLKRTATVNLKPELEIFADDVKCAHGATVGELDDRALFYMQSRGVPKPRAQALLTRAFVADAIERIGNETVADAMMADADAWLERAL